MREKEKYVFGDSVVTVYAGSNGSTFARVVESNDTVYVFEVEPDFSFRSPLPYLHGVAEDLGFIGTEVDTILLLNNLEKYITGPEVKPEDKARYKALLDERDCYCWFSEEVYNHIACTGKRFTYIGEDKYVSNNKNLIIHFPDNITPEPVEFLEV